MYVNLAILATFAFVYATVAGRIDRSVVTGPIVFIAFGLIAGPWGLGILDIDFDNVELRVIADMTLALILFIDAANADLATLRKHMKLPARMLLIGMPLVILLGVVFGRMIFPDIPIFELCVLATILAATDAALGKGVVTNKAVPARIREGLNAESGLNDGLAVPVLFLFLALAAGSGGEDSGSGLAIKLVAQELGIGMAVGIGVTLVAVWLANLSGRRGWVSDIWAGIFVALVAIACFAIAQSLHGSGYIAAFVGGLLFGGLAGKETHELVHASEGIGEVLAMTTWIMFGGVVIPYTWSGLTGEIVLYAFLSLTVIRVLPMVLALTGTGENFESKLFLGWFGPRGLASIVFVVIVAGHDLANFDTIVYVVTLTVTLCVVAHGVTANAWAKGFGRRAGGEAQNRSGT